MDFFARLYVCLLFSAYRDFQEGGRDGDGATARASADSEVRDRPIPGLFRAPLGGARAPSVRENPSF